MGAWPSARMDTPPAEAALIRALQMRALREVRDALGIAADGSFSCERGALWLCRCDQRHRSRTAM